MTLSTTVCKIIFFSCAATTQFGLGHRIAKVSRTHTISLARRLSKTPLHEESVRRRACYLHNTQRTQETNIHALNGIRTRDTRYEAPSDLRLRPHDI